MKLPSADWNSFQSSRAAGSGGASEIVGPPLAAGALPVEVSGAAPPSSLITQPGERGEFALRVGVDIGAELGRVLAVLDRVPEGDLALVLGEARRTQRRAAQQGGGERDGGCKTHLKSLCEFSYRLLVVSEKRRNGLAALRAY